MNLIQNICNQIVVPPKLKYIMMDLGYAITTYGRRYDTEIRNRDRKLIKVSVYIPKQIDIKRLCVIYLHSMNGSRLQCSYVVQQGVGLSYVQNILEKGYYLCSFDFCGCGNSEGNTISFGANQKYDVQAVINYLSQKYGIGKFVLWGRSMGAVASVKYCEMSMINSSCPEIYGMILDSPFQSLKQLIVELGVKRTELPKFVMEGFYHIIKGTLQKKGKFRIEQLEIIKSIQIITGIPILFLVSKDDTTIQASHSQNLYYSYRYWNKKLVYFNGLHNESRDEQYLQAIISYINDKINYIDQQRKSKRYKRILLEQEIIRNNIGQKKQNNGDQCQCNFWKK